jgi:predicted acylesterase/phospholipase RssA
MAAKGPEVRIGLVLYGGVSLAVYIYGVVLEVQRLLLAAAELERGEGPVEKMSPYARALDSVGASTVTVDILSGTSAGGINGILLAKALARGTDVELARELWIEGGDIDQLLQAPSTRDPRALLQSAHFEQKLREGMRLLDSKPPRERVAPPPILDLFVSSTHLRGAERVFKDSLGEEIATRQHRFVIQLKLRREQDGLGYDKDEFGDNERLVKLARATSAFPAAFEPVRIRRRDRLLGKGEEGGWFADGGILNNKPFTEAVEKIVSRRSDRPVRRWLFSIDPDPKQAEAGAGAGDQPAFDTIAMRAIASIPRYQSIARDLAALDAHNDKVSAAEELVIAGEAEISVAPEGEPGPPARARASLLWGLGAGPAAAYETLRRQAWALEVADSVMSTARVEGEGDVDRAGIHREIRWLAEGVFIAGDGGDLPDLAFQRRRVYYLIKLLSMAAEVRAAGADEPADASAVRQALWAAYEEISATLWARLADPALELAPGEAPAAVAERVRDRVNAAAAPIELADSATGALEEALNGLVVLLPYPRGVLEGTFQVPLGEAFGGFGRRDAMLLSADVYGGLRQRDRVKHAQISPAAAANTGVRTDRKLAGSSLGHFGGFLDAGWRQNDLMWGRLDGAEVLMRALLEGGEEDRREADEAAELTDAVQERIVRKEMPDLGAGPGDWKEKLREHVGDGPSLADLDARGWKATGLRAAAVLRKMLRTAGAEAGKGGVGGRIRAYALAAAANALGFVLSLVYLPATILFAKSKPVRYGATAVVFVPAVWGIVTLLLGVLGVLALGDVWLPALIGIAVYPAAMLLCWLLVRLFSLLGRLF